MDKIRLGRSGLMVAGSGFGALPLQRVPMNEAVQLLRQAFDGGINFYDTARSYTDSEEKIGRAFSKIRNQVFIATKTLATDRAGLLKDLKTSLKTLMTDYLDLYQLHNPGILPDPNDPDGLYQGLLEAKKQGLIRFIGFTNHRLDLALSAAESGLYDTMQFPLNCLSSPQDLELIEVCRKNDLGVIAMKALSGGLITRASATFAFLRQYDNLVPIWGIQRISELEEFLALEKNPPPLDKEMWDSIEKDRAELTGDFCRGCGYCMPCPQDIPINFAARMSLLLERAPYFQYIEDNWREKMNRINNCTKCGQCKKRCPYNLDTPGLLKKNLAFYTRFYEEKTAPKKS